MDVMGCESCRGTGKVIALGNFKEKCNPCLGVGYVTKKSKEEAIESTKKFFKEECDVDLDVPPKRGRKKRVA